MILTEKETSLLMDLLNGIDAEIRGSCRKNAVINKTRFIRLMIKKKQRDERI